MTDRFIDRVAELTGQTHRVLSALAEDLEAAGLTAQASTLRALTLAHEQLSIDCLTITQPIEPELFQLEVRIKKDVEELRELAADLMSRSRPGHSEISEAANILERVLEEQPEE